MKRLTREQQFAWDMLQGNPERWVTRLSAHEIGHTVGQMLSRVTDKAELHKKADLCLGLLMDRKLPPIDVIKTVRHWLTTYDLPLIPNRLSNFDRFHRKYRQYIFKMQYIENLK
jgi:hypothetical protein